MLVGLLFPQSGCVHIYYPTLQHHPILLPYLPPVLPPRLARFASVAVTKGPSSNGLYAHGRLALAAPAVRKAFAIAPVLLLTPVHRTGPDAAVQVAKPMALRALVAPVVATSLAAAVRTTEPTPLRRFAAPGKATPGPAAMAFAQSVGLRPFVTTCHMAWLAFDPPAVLVEKCPGFSYARTRECPPIGHRALLHQRHERSRWHSRGGTKHRIAWHPRRDIRTRRLQLGGQAPHNGVNEGLVPKDGTERRPVL